MFMIKFYGNFCSFHRLYILKIGIHLKHEEINWNSELQNQKAEPEAKTENSIKPLLISQGLQNFTRVVKFRGATNFLSL